MTARRRRPRPAAAGLAGAAAVMLVAAVAAPSRARADGAFPGSLQIMLPAASPQPVYLATNFGLIISDDGGATWTWTCEQRQSAMGYLYVASPTGRLFVVPAGGLAYSDDGSCTWMLAGGTLDGQIVSDVFVDPTSSDHVLAIGQPPNDPAAIASVVSSSDGGATFTNAIFSGPPGGGLTGVEIARSDPRTVYVAMYTTDGATSTLHPKLARSDDGGMIWTTLDIEPMLGAGSVRIMAVDPADAKVVYLRLIQAAQGSESVAVTRDGGATFMTPITVTGSGAMVTAFARLASGTVLVGGIGTSTGAVGFRSTDGGMTFQDWPGVPHLSALAERGGKLYAAAHNYVDGWAIGVSIDEGLAFQPLARYDQVTAIRPCAQAACLPACQYQASTNGTWPLDVCMVPAPPPPPSGGGGGCRTAGTRDGAGALAVAAAFVTLALARARRRRS